MVNCLKTFIYLFLLFPVIIFSKELQFTPEEKAWIKENPVITYSEVNWKPLSIIEDDRMKGIMGDYLDLVAKKTGLNFKFIPSDSWPHVLELFSQKKIDIVPGVGSSPQEIKLGLITTLYAKYPMVIVTNDSYKFIEGIEKLDGKVIAVPKYYTSYNFLVENFPNQKIITTKNIPEALLLVENGQADAFVGHIATSLFYIAENHLNDLKVTGKTSFDFEHHYLVQNDNPILLSIINKVVSSISHQERKVIYDKWIQTSVVEEKIDYTSIFIVIGLSLIIILLAFYRSSILKKYNKKLKDSYEDMRTIMNSTHEGIILSQEGVITGANHPAMKTFKCKSEEELIGLKVLDLIDDDSKLIVSKALKKDKAEPYEIKMKLLDGKTLPAIVKGLIMNLNGKKVRVSSFIDISVIKQQEKLIIEQSKMAAMGEMASTLAHQWRQPLAAITTIVGGWKFYHELGELDDKTVLEGADLVTKKAEQLSGTIDSFIYLFEDDKNISKFNVKELIDNILNLESSLFEEHNIKVIQNIDSTREISGNKNRAMQALLNVINNSIDVLSKKEKDKIIIISVTEEDSNIVVSIKDSGGGLQDESLTKAFEPYFSTKEDLNGLGLGLYMTYTIVKKLQGEAIINNESFTYEDKEYAGANVVITIPFN